MRSASVVIPVRDGGPLLRRVLDAVRDQGELELVVVDSGSTDGSLELARSVADVVIEIPPAEFGHGRTRNMAAERSSGELICFLTQDAVPQPGWLAAHREAFELDPRVGASFGPHLPNPETTPMIARELLEFFAGFSPDGGPTLQRSGGLTFLSNVNACYSRVCWEEIRFEDLPYSEDQAFGRAMLEAGWVKVFHPDAAVRHAHEYGPLDFVKRYFDEYRGLNETSGHVEPLRPSAALARRERRRALDARPGRAGARDRALAGRSAVHHGGRRVGSALGSRADRLPSGRSARSRSSGRGAAARRAGRGGAPAGRWTREGRTPTRRSFASPARASRRWTTRCPGWPTAPLHVATVIPPFGPGSGGHGTIFKLLAQLERMGHTCSHVGARPARSPGRRSSERAPRDRGGVRAPGRARAPGLRRLARRRRGAGHRLGHRLPVGAAAGLPGAGLPDPGPRARLPRRLGRVELVRRHVRAGPLRDLRRALAARPGGEPLRPAGHLVPASAWTTPPTTPAPWSAAATPSCSTHGRSPPGGRCRSARSRSRS